MLNFLGRDSGLHPGEEKRDVKGGLSQAEEWLVDSDLPTECGPRSKYGREISSP